MHSRRPTRLEHESDDPQPSLQVDATAYDHMIDPGLVQDVGDLVKGARSREIRVGELERPDHVVEDRTRAAHQQDPHDRSPAHVMRSAPQPAIHTVHQQLLESAYWEASGPPGVTTEVRPMC